MKQGTLFGEDEPTFTNRKTAAVTFQGKLKLPIHRWYRLTPSFSPRLASDIADRFRLSESDMVLDPFSGVGTVPLCMKYRGVPACSVELNPYLHFVGAVKTRTYRDLDEIDVCFSDFIRHYRRKVQRLPGEIHAQGWLRENPEFVPRIANADRWWSPGNLMQLACLRRLVCQYDAGGHHLDLLKMGALGILVPVSNARHNHVSLTFAERPLPTVDIPELLAAKYHEMIYDLRAVAKLRCSEVAIHAGKRKHLSAVSPTDCWPSAVITSPPYPNRFSYARETRRHLFFFDFIADATAVGELETAAIGGTWGKATSVLSAGVMPENDLVRGLLAPYTGNINGSGPLMAHYVTKYFNDMYIHAAEIAAVCREKARLAYVIGNSKFYDHPLPSDELLASIFGHFGFALERIDRMRKRQSKAGLYEAVVFMRRG